MPTPPTAASRKPSQVVVSVTSSDCDSSAQSETSVRRISARRRQHIGRNVSDPHHQFPDRKTERQHDDRQRERAGPGSPLMRRLPPPWACASASEVWRHAAINPAEVRKCSPRGYGASIASSVKTRPGRAAITTMRLDR